MAAQASITAFDGASTPLTHTFAAGGVKSNEKENLIIANWREALLTVPSYAALRLVSSYQEFKSGVTRAGVQVVVPFMESISGQNASGYTAAQKVAHEVSVMFTVMAGPRATPADRRMARQLCLNVCGGIATSVAPVATGQMPDLLDLGFQVS